MHHQHGRPGGEEHHRREVLLRIIRQLGVEVLQHRIGAVEAEINGVAIGRRLGDIVGRQHAVRAGAVLDHDHLSGALLYLGGEGAAQDVGHAARRGRHDDSHRTVGKVLAHGRAGDGCDPCGRHRECQGRAALHHGVLPFFISVEFGNLRVDAKQFRNRLRIAPAKAAFGADRKLLDVFPRGGEPLLGARQPVRGPPLCSWGRNSVHYNRQGSGSGFHVETSADLATQSSDRFGSRVLRIRSRAVDGSISCRPTPPPDVVRKLENELLAVTK